jgi:hypothetical protein
VQSGAAVHHKLLDALSTGWVEKALGVSRAAVSDWRRGKFPERRQGQLVEAVRALLAAFLWRDAGKVAVTIAVAAVLVLHALAFDLSSYPGRSDFWAPGMLSILLISNVLLRRSATLP